MKSIIALLLTIGIVSAADYPEIPRHSGDKCAYYLVDAKRSSDIVTAITMQDCPTYGKTYTRAEYSCNNLQYRVYGEGSKIAKIKKWKKSRWTKAIYKSSRADALDFVCARIK